VLGYLTTLASIVSAKNAGSPISSYIIPIEAYNNYFPCVLKKSVFITPITTSWIFFGGKKEINFYNRFFKIFFGLSIVKKT
jgi:hypothetical protein